MTAKTFRKRTTLRVAIETECVSNDPWKFRAKATVEIWGGCDLSATAFSDTRSEAAGEAVADLFTKFSTRFDRC